MRMKPFSTYFLFLMTTLVCLFLHTAAHAKDIIAIRLQGEYLNNPDADAGAQKVYTILYQDMELNGGSAIPASKVDEIDAYIEGKPSGCISYSSPSCSPASGNAPDPAAGQWYPGGGYTAQ
jgi:hypothetical protein